MAALTVGGAFLSASLQVLFDRLASPTLQEFGSLWGVEHELQRLRRSLLKILSAVDDIEMRPIRDCSTKTWLTELKDAAYHAEDILDEFEAEVLRQQVESPDQVSAFFSSLTPNQVLFNREISQKINAIRDRLDDIARDRYDLKLGEREGSLGRPEAVRRRETSSLVSESCVFGRDEDRDNVVGLLASDGRDPPSSTNVSGLLIAGMGGLGKTTLAQLVYNDQRINSYFQLKMWVCVSQDFDATRISREMMESATRGRYSQVVNWNTMQENLKEELGGVRFLLVLDDVWNADDRCQWEQLCLPLMFGGKGSRILITSRNKNVANIMGSTALYCLEGLSDEHCWLIFKKSAFACGTSNAHPGLEEIGKKIVSKLKGLPLAAKTLGGLLSSKLDEDSWRNVLESEIWELPHDGEGIVSSLRTSYQHLPAHLKQCFAYCSLFPKESEFEKDKMTQIWMAQGFIRPQGRRRIEDVGSECFNELVCRSFFEHFEECYLMHDMIHDLAHSVSLGECFSVGDAELRRVPEKARHLSLVSDSLDPNSFKDLHRFKSLRTLLFLHKYRSGFDHIPEDLFIKLKYLRTLDLSHNNIKGLPESIGKLKLLRYLDLSFTSITNLPKSTGSLHNLQTLKLEACPLHELPRGMTNLINLRHLKVRAELVSMISGIGRLTCLQELVEFKVQMESGHKIAELRDMTELQKIHISNLESVISREEAREAELSNKKYLRLLTLEWSYNREVRQKDVGLDGEVLEVLQPHPNLRELNIWDNAGSKFPSWMRNHSLSNLETICLRNCKKWEVLPALGELRFLRYLQISGMDGVKWVDPHFYGSNANRFPSLVELQFVNMPEWEVWSSSTEEGQLFPCLRELLIVSCPKLRELPPLPPTLARLWIRKVGLQSLPDLWGYCGATQDSSFPSASSLSTLEISECPNLTSLREGLLQHYLRDLKSLNISDCAELNHVPEKGGFPALAYLKSLTMENCPKLTALLEDGISSLLAHLKIGGCPDLRIGHLQKLNSLYSLVISDCPNISSLPEEALCSMTALEELTISDCRELTSLQFQTLVTLKRLTIENCPKLNSSSLLPSSSLEYLEINNISAVAGFLQNLNSLLVLRIHECPQLTSFAGEEEELQKLSSLQSIHIHDCVNLQLLPAALHSLTSLEHLYLQNCPQIQSLPENGLPSSLTVLDIRRCPVLEDRCRKDGGPDWPKIADIPNLHILGESHMTSGTEERVNFLVSTSSAAAATAAADEQIGKRTVALLIVKRAKKLRLSSKAIIIII